MNSTERAAFREELEVLFGAFPPARLSDAQEEAYWRGLAAMSLPAFRRAVERAIDAERGEERLPSPRRLWAISLELRDEARSREQRARKEAEQHVDQFVAYANRVLLWFCLAAPGQSPEYEDGIGPRMRQMRGAPSRKSLRAILDAKNKLVRDYQILCADGPGALPFEERRQIALEFRDRLLEVFERLFEPMPEAEREQIARNVERLHHVGDLA